MHAPTTRVRRVKLDQMSIAVRVRMLTITPASWPCEPWIEGDACAGRGRAAGDRARHMADGDAERADHHAGQQHRAEDAAARQQQAEARGDFGAAGDEQEAVAEAEHLELLDHQARAGELGVAGRDRDHAEQDLRCVDADGLGHGTAPCSMRPP